MLQSVFRSTLIAALLHGAATLPGSAQAGDWYSDVIQVMVDGAPLDIADGRESITAELSPFDSAGHAAPEVYDWNQDGLPDLLVGGFSGQVRVYLNEGTARVPIYSGYDWIRTKSGSIARVYNYCCIPTGIQVADLNEDGVADVTMGAYAPAGIFWFKGLDEGLEPRQTLTEGSGFPVLADLPTIAGDNMNMRGSLGTKVAWMDWNDDGTLDVVMGTAVSGALVVRLNHGPRDNGLTVIPDQPLFGPYSGFNGQLDVFDFIEDRGVALRDQKKLVPEAADWDGDGLVDILVGVENGAVYWLRNIGELGEPFFAAPDILIPPLGYQAAVAPRILLKEDETVGRGSRVSIDVADYNDDGKLDLLVGDWSRTIKARSDLTEAERRRFEEVQQALVELDQAGGMKGPPEPFRDRRFEEFSFAPNSEQGFDLRTLETELWTFLELVNPGREGDWPGYTRNHGHVWVYLRK